MNEKLIQLAEQAGLDMRYSHCIEGNIYDLEQFAELVRQDEQARCIGIIEDIYSYDMGVDEYYSEVYVKAIKGELRRSE